MVSCNFFVAPSSTLNNSIKLVSFLSVRSFFANLTLILNLSAPGAAKLLNPFALSYNDESSFAFIISSTISNPTLKDGVLL